MSGEASQSAAGEVRFHTEDGEFDVFVEPQPGQPSAAPSPSVGANGEADVDYEGTGQAFVPKQSLKRADSMSLTGTGTASKPATPKVSAVNVEMQSVPPSKPLEEQKEGQGAGAASTASATKPVETGEDTSTAPADSIWRLTPQQVSEKFQMSNIDLNQPADSIGLTSATAAELLLKNGRNELKPPPEKPEIVKYLLQYTDPFMLLLILAGILSAAVAYPVDTSQPINLYIGIVLWGVVFLSATFSYVQEGKASSVMNSFKGMLPAQARVIRDGAERGVPAAEVVVGDLLKIEGGDVIPADIRLLWTQDCKVETSSLTGESLPITTGLRSPNTDKIEQAKNVCFNSSKCLEGECIGVVFATGDKTLIGQIAGLAGQTKSEDTTLQKEIKIFVRRLTIFSVIMGIIFFVIGIARGQNWVNAFINGFIVVMIANVPEGLPMTVVSCLTITARRLGSLNVFVKQLQSVETLGSVTVIASDKTGTLTQNIMAVANFYFDSVAQSADSIFQHYPPHRVHKKKNKDGTPANDDFNSGSTLEQLELIAVICSKAHFDDERHLTAEQAKQIEQIETLKFIDPSMTLRSAKAQYPTIYGKMDSSLTLNSGRMRLLAKLGSAEMMDDSTRKVIGDASETALFNFVKQRQSVELMRYHNEVVYSMPFNSRNKYALAITKCVGLPHESAEKRTLLMKGAPEIVVSRCTHYMRHGEILPIDPRFKSEFQKAYENFGSKGQRVLGFATLNLPEDQFGSKMDSHYAEQAEKVPTTGLVFVGLISLVDPPKVSVPQAVLDCHTAGVKVIMVTGDHPLTAAAIARQVNIFQEGNYTRDELAQIHNVPPEEIPEEDVDCIAVKGTDLDHFTEADWARVLAKPNIVFARTTPTQKLIIVEHLQAMGHIVAATGDGVNDSPALKKADIGVAMGINGSDVARDAAAVILMDDDFSSIVVGIREGRTIFDNLTKTIAYTLTHMIPEVATILLNLALGFPPGLSALMILTIDLFTELPPAVSMAYEPSEADVMKKMPRNAKTDRLVTMKVVMYSLAQAGVIETLNGFLAFFLVFRYYGVRGSELFNTSYFQANKDHPIPPFPGCYTLDSETGPYPLGGYCYDDDDQNKVLYQAQTAYYAMLVCAQVFHVWLCKTRNLSIFEHGLLRNDYTLWGVAVEICIIILVIFAPSSNTIFFTQPFPPRFWGLIVLAPFVLFCWQEGRKWYVRRNPNSFIARYVHW